MNLQVALLSMWLITLCPQLSEQSGCPPGWTSLSGSCILINATARVAWCDANRECAKLGAELVTNFEVISNLRSTSPNKNLWVGVSDLANEREKNRDGWQFVNGRGVMINASQDPTGPWHPTDPNNPPQDCAMFASANGNQGLMDRFCDDATAGFVCELMPLSATPASCGAPGTGTVMGAIDGRVRWQPQLPRPATAEKNDESSYCWVERSNVRTLFECAMLSGSRPYSRSFFFNSAESRCRVLEFSDSQTSLDAGPSTGWVKYLRV